MVTLQSIFDAFGGPAGLGRAIGRSTEHATTMRRRRSIPVRYWPQLIWAARVRGVDWITYESITLAHADLAKAGPDRKQERRAS